MRVPTTFKAPLSGSVLALMLLMTVMMGLNAGLAAESEAEIHSQFEEARDIDFDEQSEDYDDPAVPDSFENSLEQFEEAGPQILPESVDRAIENGVQSFTKSLLIRMFNIAEAIALFAFNNQAVVGHPAAVAITKAVVYIAPVAMVGLHIRRLRRGVDG